jgi:hypothetical protein
MMMTGSDRVVSCAVHFQSPIQFQAAFPSLSTVTLRDSSALIGSG